MVNAAVTGEQRNPPIDYVVAAWLGMPDREMARGLREGWLRAPAGVDARMWAEQRGWSEGVQDFEGAGHGPTAPPSPEGTSPSSLEATTVAPLRERLETLLRRLDPALDATTFERAWDEAGPDDVSRAGNLLSFVAGALNHVIEPEQDAAAQFASLESMASAYDGDARFIRITGATSRELESLAASDASVRRALAEHSPWVLAGDSDLARAADAAGRYDRFDRDTGEALLSDAWIADRAKHAAWRSAQAAGDAREIPGEGWRFVDRAAGVTTVAGVADGAWLHQVIFAADEGERISGEAGTDRIHGGIGDDILRGRAGDDLLEGGGGSDVLQGGAGKDVLAGQQGSDELEGGSGDDDLTGGGGDDELTGGRGNDILRGGAGTDIYRFDAGDGHDTIDDDAGVVVIDDIALAGTMLRNAEGWSSADGRFTFALEGEGTGRALLVRSAAQEESGGDALALRIASWRDGAFGISLESESDDAAGDAIDPPDQGHAGNEAPLGVNASPLAADATANADAIAGSEAPLPPDSFDWLSSPSKDGLAFVDLPDWAAALDGWAAPPVPEGGSTSGDTLGVTAYDVGDAVASTASDGDDVDGVGDVSFPAFVLPVAPALRGEGPRSPPELLLRPSP